MIEKMYKKCYIMNFKKFSPSCGSEKPRINLVYLSFFYFFSDSAELYKKKHNNQLFDIFVGSVAAKQFQNKVCSCKICADGKMLSSQCILDRMKKIKVAV